MVASTRQKGYAQFLRLQLFGLFVSSLFAPGEPQQRT